MNLIFYCFTVGTLPVASATDSYSMAFDKLRLIAARYALWALDKLLLAARCHGAVVAVSHAAAGTGPTVSLQAP